MSLAINSEYSEYYYNSYDSPILEALGMFYEGMKELAFTLSFSYTFEAQDSDPKVNKKEVKPETSAD